MRTRAAILVEAGRPMIIDEIELPSPGPTQVLLRQFASGVCHSQLHVLNNPDPPVPIILGHESTGEIVEVGSDVRNLQPGDRVMVTWVRKAAADNGPSVCPANLWWHGKAVQFAAPAETGVFTWCEHSLVDQQFVVDMDDPGAPTDVTSIIGCAVMTGCGAALFSAGVRATNSVAVIGVGGVGLCIVQACANAGASPIIAVDVSDEKLEFAKKFGVTACINSRRENLGLMVRRLTASLGVDFAFDAIGVAETMEQALAIARPGVTGLRDGGTAVLVGVPHGPPPAIEMRQLFGGKIYRGAPGGSGRPERDFRLYLRWFKEGKLPLDLLVTRRYKLDEINEACAALQRGEIAGRAIIEF
jgi:Zn-dependent alcohol dehydrogenase